MRSVLVALSVLGCGGDGKSLTPGAGLANTLSLTCVTPELVESCTTDEM